MRVSELKQWPKIYKLCEEYWDDESSEAIGEGFVWDCTPQGVGFWCALDNGDIEEAKSLQPHLFEEEEVDSEGFIKWNGGEVPVPKNVVVDVKFREDTIDEGDTAGCFHWGHSEYDGEYDIVGYKLHNTVIKAEFNPPKAGGSEYKITGTISLGEYRQDTPENNYTKQPLQDAYKAWAFSEPFGVPWLDGERKQLQEFKLNTRKSLNKLAVQGLVSGDMIAKFDELLKEI